MKQLQENGTWYDVVCAREPAEIMAWLVARTFDLYLVDNRMSRESALGVCRSIRSVDDDGAIICISDDIDDRDTLLEAGADLFMKKPDAVPHLRRTIDDVLDGPRSDAIH
jgi:DNA-binding response OmpR family regulator